MTFMEQELRKLFDNDAVFLGTCFVGNSCYGRVTEDVRIRIYFASCGIADYYDALNITLLNRREGQIDCILLKFRDIWGMKTVNLDGTDSRVGPRVWSYQGNASGIFISPRRANTNSLRKQSETMWNYFRSRICSRRQNNR